MPPLPPHAVHILGALWAYKNNRKERSVTVWKIIQGSRSHHKYTIGRMNELFRWKRALTPISSIELKTKLKKKRPGKALQIPIKLELLSFSWAHYFMGNKRILAKAVRWLQKTSLISVQSTTKRQWIRAELHWDKFKDPLYLPRYSL